MNVTAFQFFMANAPTEIPEFFLEKHTSYSSCYFAWRVYYAEQMCAAYKQHHNHDCGERKGGVKSLQLKRGIYE
jgi:hypothetical protein